MAGRGAVSLQDQKEHPRVFSFGEIEEWIHAVDPIHFDKPAIAGVGPGVSFGKKMAAFDPSIRIGLIPCAVGGTPIEVWKPGAYWESPESGSCYPYDDAIRRTKNAMRNGELKGILWHQGESDSIKRADAIAYEDRLIHLIRTIRNDLAILDLPFVVASLGDYVIERRPDAEIVNTTLKQIPTLVNNTAFVDSSGLVHKGDGEHFNSASALELGQRYADVMQHLLQKGAVT